MRLFFYILLYNSFRHRSYKCESLFDFGFRICRDIRDQNLLPAMNNTWSRQEILTLPFFQILEIIKRNSVRIYAKLSLYWGGEPFKSSLNLLKITFCISPNRTG
jgi:hypothetical protein